MRLGIVGFGSIANRVYLDLYLNNKDIDEILIYGRKIEDLAHNLAKYNLLFFDNFETMIEQVDVLMVHSATIGHYEYIKKAIEKNIPVYVDKPLTDSLRQSKELIKLAKKNDTLLFVGYNRRYAPLYNELKKKNLEILRIHYEKHRNDLTYNEDYQTAIIDDFIHLIDSVDDILVDDIKLKSAQANISNNNELISLYTDFSNSKTIITLFMGRSSGSDYERVTIDAKGILITINNMREMILMKNNKVEIIKTSDRISDSEIRGFKNSLIHFFDLTKNNKFIPLKQMDSEIYCNEIIKKIKPLIK